MKNLRQYIRNMLIAESARILDIDTMDLIREEGLIIVVDETSFSGEMSHIRVNLYQALDLEGVERTRDIRFPALGAVSADIEPMFGTGYEDNTFVVYQARLRHDFREKGIGALLYNVLLAQISRDKKWLASDRESVSSMAMRIWDTWNKMPAIYDVDQMDQSPFYGDYFLTPETEDDVKQNAFYHNIAVPIVGYGKGEESERALQGDYKKAFLESGLTKRFQMKDPKSFLRDLEEYGILRYAS